MLNVKRIIIQYVVGGLVIHLGILALVISIPLFLFPSMVLSAPLAGFTEFNLNPYDPSSCNSIECFIVKIAKYLFYAAIPLFVIMILYAGMRFLTARGEPGKIATAKNILWYAIVGLTIVLIGVGFVSLIESVIGFPSTT